MEAVSAVPADQKKPVELLDDAPHLLVIDDDRRIRELIKRYLAEHGFRVTLAADAKEARNQLEGLEFDLLIVDVMMPGETGISLTKSISTDRKVPVLMLTALAETDNRIEGLEAGADDYLTKPFDKNELLARIQAIVRRSQGHAQSVIQTGKLAVNLDANTVEVAGQTIHLTGKEYGILELLSLRKGTTLTKEMFLNHLYGGMDEPELKIIDVFICKLRKKLAEATNGENYIETVWGRGYVLRDPDEQAPAVREARA